MGGVNKKRPSSKTKGKDKGPKQAKEPKRPAAPKEEELQVLPQERVVAVRPFWERVQPEDRPELLTLDVADLRARAAVLTERYQKLAAAEIADAEAAGEELLPLPVEPTLSEVLEEGLSRLQTEKNTWKVWQWPADDDGKGGAEFYDAESFRNCVEEQHLDPELKALLPKDPPGTRPIEKPAEAALRQRMSDLLSQVHTHNRQLQEEAQQQRRPATRRGGEQLHVRDANVDLITTMLAALEKEHEFLYHAVLFPVTSFVCEVLPEGQRESSRTELFYEDLDRLSPDDVARISEWITEKVDGFSAKLKPEAKDAELEEEEEGIGDVDLFTLVDGGARLAVNAKWLGHLADRQLGEDGHPRKVGPKEDPHKMGLVLEWVYGTIVSTAEKARDGAKRALGGRMPTARAAHEALVTALADQASWAARTTAAKELLAAMLASRRSAADLAKQYDIRPQPPASEKPDEESRELPDEVIMAMLRREVLLTRAKLHGLCYDQIMGERKLRSLKTQLRQGEPEFDRLKRELEEVKNAPRGLEGTFRSAAEMERHRAAAADAAIEEQLEVQTSFRQHGARLQGIYDKRQRTEVEMAKRDQELKQLQGWRSTVQSLLERFQELVAQQAAAAQAAAANGTDDDAPVAEQPAKADADRESAAAAAEEGRSLYDANGNIDAQAFHAELAKQAAAAQTSQQESTLQKLRQHFQRDVRKQLYTDEDDCTFFAWIQKERKTVEERLADGAAALQHLEMALVNTACDDPGAAVGAQLALPLLQDRLDKHALEYATQRAAEAEAAIVQMDEEKRQREVAARERKVQAKSKVKTKARSEKEKLQAEKEAAEAAAKAAAAEAIAERLAAAEEEKKLRAEEALKARLEEEAIMEARRQELLSEEGGYWSRRMAAEQAAAEQLAAAQQALIESANMEDPAKGTSDRNGKTLSARQAADRQPRRRGSPSPGAEQLHGRTVRDLEAPRAGSGSFGRKSPPVPRPHAATNGSADRPALPPNKKARGPDGMFPAERPVSQGLPVRAEASGPQRPLQNGHAPAAGRRSASGGPASAEASAQPSGEAVTKSPSQQPQQQQSQPQQQQPQMTQAGSGQLQSAPSSSSASGRPVPPRPVIIVPPAALPRAKAAGQAPASGAQQQHLLPPSQPQKGAARLPPVLVVPPPAGAQPSGGSPPPPQSAQRPTSAVPQQLPPPGPQQQQLPNGVHNEHPVQFAGPPQSQQQQQQGGPRELPTANGTPSGGSPPPPPHLYHGSSSPQQGGPGMPPPPPQQQPGGMIGTPPPHMMMQQQFGGPGVPPPHMMPLLPGGMMHAPPGAGPYMMGNPQMGGPPAGSGPPAMNGPPGAFMIPPSMHGGFPSGTNGPMPPHLSGSPMHHHMQQPSRQHLPPDMGPPPPPPGNLPFPPMQMAQDPGYPGPSGMQPDMMLPPHSHPGAYPAQGLQQQQQQQHQEQHMLPDPHAPPPPPGTPPLPEGGTPKGGPERQQMWDAAQRQQHGGGSAPPAPSTPPRATMLRAAAQPFVPRATAPPFVPGGAPSSGEGASSQRSGSPPASEDSAVSVTAPGVPPQQPEQQQQQPGQQPAGEHQQADAAPQQQAAPLPAPQPQQQQQQTPAQGVGYVPPHLRRHPQQQQQQSQPPQDAHCRASGSAASTGDSLERQWSGSEASSLMAAPPAAYAVPPRIHQQQPQYQQQAGPAPQQQQQPQQQAAHQHAAPAALQQAQPAPQQQQQQQPRLQPPSQSNSAIDLRAMDAAAAAAAAEAERLRHSASQPALGGAGSATPPRAWSSIAAANSSQGGGGSGGGGGVALPASLRASSHPALNALASQQAGQQPTAQQQAARRLGGSMRAGSAAGALNPSGASPGQASSMGSGGASPTRGAASGGPGVALGVYRAGGVLWDGLQPDAQRLKLVRGLTSEAGQNNCFLNVIIQSLWHLGCFRTALLAPGRPIARGPPADRRVVDALVSIFHAFAAAPAELDVPNGEAGGPESPTSESSANLQGGWAVSPAELREALGALSGGGFGLSDMHDAAEVLGELLACLHRAEVGATDVSSDPLLPRRVRLPAPGGGRPGAGPAMAMAAPRSGNLDKGRTAVSTVLRLFGLEVQVPCPAEDDGAAPGQLKQQQRSLVKGAPGAAPTLAPGDLAQYWEYCHLVPAKGLRTAYDSLLDGSFEEMLRAADDEEGLLSRAAGGLANGAGGGASGVVKTLLRRPRVFILGVVWETPQAKDDAIASTVAALRTEVDVGGVFRGVPPGPPHRLRCLVAYSGHHYQAYALVEELGRWLLFDDAAIRLVGGWADVAASMRACRHQPSLLFYERAD